MQIQPSKTSNHFASLEADTCYHVFNRTNNREVLFRSDYDRRFFLERYNRYLSPFVDTFAYCLIPNHFHFLLQIKSVKCITTYLQQLEPIERTIPQNKFLEMKDDEINLHPVLENQFLRLFTAYAMDFNKRYNRTGNLFHRPFRRVAVDNECHFTRLIYYIHTNPVKHGVTQDFCKYHWSSYAAYLSAQPTKLSRTAVLEWFGDKESFVAFHQQVQDISTVEHLLIEG